MITAVALPLAAGFAVVVGLVSAAVAWLICARRLDRGWDELKQRNQELTIRTEQAEKLIEELRAEGRANDEQIQLLTARAIAAEATLESERKAHEEKLAELQMLEQRMREAFESLSTTVLQRNTEQFFQLAQEKLDRQAQVAKGNLDLHKHEITALIEPLKTILDQQRQSLTDIERERQKAYGSIEVQLQAMAAGQQELKSETVRLVKALRQPQVRGRWGELQLRRAVELAGLSQHCDFLEQRTHRDGDDNVLRPDMQVCLPNNRRIIVDSKVPLEAYLEALDAPDDDSRAERLKLHARHVRGHIDMMSRRDYHKHIDGAHDFTVLFIPGDVFYNAALEHDHELLEYAIRKGVILASPATLIALLKAVALGWREVQLAENAQQIRKQGEEIYRRINTLAEHFARIGKSLNGSVKAYNDAVASMERNLLTSARRMHDLQIGDKEVPNLDLVGETARQFSKPELSDGARQGTGLAD